MISKIVTTWWFSFLRLLIASTISSWMCLAHLSSYFLSSASSLKKKIMFVLDKSSSEFITLLFGDLVCYMYYTLPCSLCTAASSASQDGPLILVHGFSLVKVGKVLDSPVGHTLHILFIFILIFSLSSIAQRVSSLSWHFLTMARLLLADFSIQFFDLFPYDVHIGFFHDQFFYLAQIA